MDWIILYQNPYDRVVFLSSLNTDEKDSMPYHKFLEFITHTFSIKDYLNFQDQLDRFKVICLLKDGSWEVQEQVTQQTNFEEMVKLNAVADEKSAFEKRVDRSKAFMNNIFVQNKRKGI